MVDGRLHVLPEVAVRIGEIAGASSAADARLVTEHFKGLIEVASTQWPRLTTNAEGSWIAEALVGSDQYRLGTLSILIDHVGWLEGSPAVRVLAVSLGATRPIRHLTAA